VSDPFGVREFVSRDVQTAPPATRAAGEPSKVALWTGVLLAPMAVMWNIQAGYALAPVVCEKWPKSMSHIVVAAMLLLCIAGGLIAHRNWVVAGRGWPEDLANPVERSRFLAAVGMLFSALCALVILGQWLGPIILRACQ
jgi:hypothetical protein